MVYNPLLPHFHAYVMRMILETTVLCALLAVSQRECYRLQWTGHKLLFAHKYLFLIIKCVNYISLDKLRELSGESFVLQFVLQKAASLEKVNFQKCPC